MYLPDASFCPEPLSPEPSLTWLTSAVKCSRAQNGRNRNRTALREISIYLDDAKAYYAQLWVRDVFGKFGEVIF